MRDKQYEIEMIEVNNDVMTIKTMDKMPVGIKCLSFIDETVNVTKQ
jgi:hypothetical protein